MNRDEPQGLVRELATAMRSRLHDAAARADEEVLRELLLELADSSPLTAALARAIEEYRFDEIVVWTSPPEI